MKIQNNQNGEILSVSNVFQSEGQIIYRINGRNWQRPGTRFFNSFPMLSDTGGTTADGWAILDLSEPWQIVSGSRSNGGTTETTNTDKQETRPTLPTSQAADNTENNSSDADLLLSLLRKQTGGVDASKVREIVLQTLSELAGGDSAKIKTIARKAADKNAPKCDDYDDILQDIADGYNVYLFGPAGSGKSHTAEQIAADLGLDFYGQTTIQFAHDVRGYGDAGGKFVDTPFFKAFKNGGLYFQDEYDRSNAEAAIVLNTALANHYYDFPVVGRVNAHPNFRFLAAGNTVMTGADENYITGQIIDASGRDRFGAYYEIGYNHTVEMSIAGGDAETVNFNEDLRKAIKAAGLNHVVSYRATAYMVNRKKDLVKTLQRCTFKGLQIDEIRIICNYLQNKSNSWAQAAEKLCR